MFITSGRTKEVDILYQTYHGISVAEPAAYIIYYWVVGLIVIMSFVGGRRAFCHYICWMAPFMVIGTKINNLFRLSSLKLSADKDKCVNCGICSKNCVMSLPVNEMVQKNSIETPKIHYGFQSLLYNVYIFQREKKEIYEECDDFETFSRPHTHNSV
jgi:hypothetical protein